MSDNRHPAEQSGASAAPPPPERMRVAWIAGEDTLDRLARVLQPLAIGLMDELVEVTVFCPRGSDASELPRPPVEVVEHGRLRWLGFRTRATDAMAQEVCSRKIDLVHALEAGLAELARDLAAAAGRPYVVSAWTLGDGRRLGHMHRRATGVLATSEPVRRDLLKHHVAPPDRIGLVRPGAYQVRHATCFVNPRQSVAIVAGGRLEHFPAWEAVLEAFRRLRAAGRNCAYFVLGRGRIEERLRARSVELGLSHDLTFAAAPTASQVPGILKGADIYISPVPSRTVDVQAMLAMAAGDPVLAAPGGAADFLIDGKTALLFQPGDAGELVRKLASLLDDQAYAQTLAENALEYLQENHSPARLVSRLAAIYRQT